MTFGGLGSDGAGRKRKLLIKNISGQFQDGIYPIIRVLPALTTRGTLPAVRQVLVADAFDLQFQVLLCAVGMRDFVANGTSAGAKGIKIDLINQHFTASYSISDDGVPSLAA